MADTVRLVLIPLQYFFWSNGFAYCFFWVERYLFFLLGGKLFNELAWPWLFLHFSLCPFGLGKKIRGCELTFLRNVWTCGWIWDVCHWFGTIPMEGRDWGWSEIWRASICFTSRWKEVKLLFKCHYHCILRLYISTSLDPYQIYWKSMNGLFVKLEHFASTTVASLLWISRMNSFSINCM